MIDQAVVKKVDGPYAVVIVQPKEACHTCAARALCSFQESGQAFLRALNPIKAKPGDVVEIEVPDANYSRQFILIFSLLILFSTGGALLGVIFSSLLGLSPNTSGVIGFFMGIALASLLIAKRFRQPKKMLLPIIREILNHGGFNE